MAAKLTGLTHKIAIRLHLVAESSATCSSRSRRPVRKLLDAPLYMQQIAEHYVLRKLQRVLPSMESCCEKWGIKINENKTQFIYFSRRRRPVEVHLTLKGRNIAFVKCVKYVSATFYRKIIFRIHIDPIAAKAFRTFIRIYSLLKIEHLSANTKVTLHKILIRSTMTCPPPQPVSFPRTAIF
jgi:hypothetical protein